MNIRAEPGYNSNATVEPTLNALEMTFSGGYQDGGVPPDEVLSLLHAAGETTDGTAYYEFSISSTTFTEVQILSIFQNAFVNVSQPIL